MLAIEIKTPGGPEALVAGAIDKLEIACDAYLSVSTPVQPTGSGIR